MPFGLAAVGLSLGKKLAKRIGKKNRAKIAKVVSKVKGAKGAVAAGTAGAAGGYLAGARGFGDQAFPPGMGPMGGKRRGPGSGGGGGMFGFGHRRYRRINPGNVRAMRRAIRRVTSGAKMYSKLFGITHGKIHGAPKVHIRKRRRAA